MDYLGPPANHGGSGNLPVKRIVIHATVGAEPGTSGAARGIARYFRTTSRNASAHVAVDSREAVRCAWDSVVCFHAPPNTGSLGYELCCSLNNEGQGHWQDADHQAMLRIAAREVAADCKEHGIPIRKLSPADLRAGREGICGHIDVSNAWGQTSHWDPGPYFPWSQFIGLVQEAANPTPEKDWFDMASLQDLENKVNEPWMETSSTLNSDGRRSQKTVRQLLVLSADRSLKAARDAGLALAVAQASARGDLLDDEKLANLQKSVDATLAKLEETHPPAEGGA